MRKGRDSKKSKRRGVWKEKEEKEQINQRKNDEKKKNTFKSSSMIDLSTIPTNVRDEEDTFVSTPIATSVPHANTTLIADRRRNTIDVVMNGTSLSRIEIIIVMAIVLFIIAIVVSILLTPVFVYFNTAHENVTKDNGIYSTS